jgi:DNA repair exonuclease SbcCD ATPase subunit
LKEENKVTGQTIQDNKGKIEEDKKLMENDSKSRDILLSSKQKVDSSLLNIDVTTVENRIANITDEGKKNNLKIAAAEKELADYGEVEYNDDDYKALQEKKDGYTSKLAQIRADLKTKKKEAEALEKDEYCPTCGQKWPNRDNSAAIAKLKEEYTESYNLGIKLKGEQDAVVAEMNAMEENRKKHIEKNKKELTVASLKVEREKMLAEYKRLKKIADDYKENKDTIIKNNEIDAQVNVLKTNIETYDTNIRRLENENVSLQKDIDTNNETVREKEPQIKQIENAIETEKTWRLYLQMVGKDGISKMVLRNTIPTINNALDDLLCDVADFKIEVEVNEKNDIEFWLIRDDVKTRLAAGSGLERTEAALALRVVLANMSNLSRPPFIVLDEILGSVAAENYDDMKKLYDKIVLQYDFVLHICHIDLDWYDKTILVTKQNNVSTISVD